MTIDVERVRTETAACGRVHHLNNAGASPSPDVVVDTVVGHLRREAEIGGYEAAAEAGERLENVYASVAQLVNGAPDEIALVENATRAWDMAFYGLTFGAGDRILTGRSEYGSNAMALLQVAARTGAAVEVIDDDGDGQIDLEQLSDAIDERVRLIALTHVPTNGGLVNPAAEVGRIARDAGIPYLLDACQSAGQLVLDVEHLGCDVLTATGRKFLRGPRGTGFAWVRREFTERIDPPMPDMRAATWTGAHTYELRPDARRLETWESAVAARLGLGSAIDYALDLGVDAIEHRVTDLAATLRGELAAIPTVTIRDKGHRQCGIVTFTVDGVPSPEVVDALRSQRVNTSLSTATSAQWDLGKRGLADVVRASVHYFNDRADLDALLTALSPNVGA